MTTQPLPDAELVDRGPSTLGRVIAEAVANTFSGVGLGLLTGVALWALGCTWPTVATWAAASAIAWAGAINWLRFSQDELANQLTFWRMARDNAALHEMVNVLERENDALTDRIEWLELRQNQPMKINGVAQPSEENPAHKDARILIQRQYGEGKDVTVEALNRMGWSDDRYSAALALLKGAGIVTMRGKHKQWALHHSPAEACAVLSAHTPVVADDTIKTINGGEGA